MPPPVQPPPEEHAGGGLDEETLQAIMAMDGMSEADKQALIDEQLKIMKSIESNKKSSQVSAADAFEQRSLNAAVSSNSGAYGTAVEDDDQMAADAKLAELLQKEEYAAADQQQQRQERSTTQRSRAAAASAKNSGGGTWMEWLGLGGSAPAPSRPEQEEVTFSGGEGRTATQQPLFACVTDSMNTAANYAMSLQEDDEGNVHGVDASSLLAVPQVGRNTDGSKR